MPRQDIKYRTARKKDRQNRQNTAGRIGQAEQARQKWTDITGQDRTGQAE